jgi:FMN phosphatase YigB (HAD superfamily)
MKNVKHIFFDLDHTLWDFEKNSSLTFKFLIKKI